MMKVTGTYQWIKGLCSGTANALLVGLTLTLMPGLGGCPEAQKTSSLTLQPQPITDVHHPMSRQFARQTDNAALHNMSISAIHFMPHRAHLNSLGCQRLNRLAWIVQNYGGQIILDLEQPDTALAQEREKVVRDYLLAWGLSAEQIDLVAGTPAGKGLHAQEAIQIHKDTRYKPQEDGGSCGKTISLQ